MTEAERARLAEARRLIFKNLAKEVPVAKVAGAFRMSEKEVTDHFQFVARAIKEYRFRRALIFHKLDTPRDAITGNRVFIDTLSKLGPMVLTSDHKLSQIVTTTISDAVASGKVAEIEARQAGR